jgi:ferric-dicitrate binding protein FerR (iron transport regulator)
MEPHYEALMVKVTDDTATPAEREALMRWLVDQPELRIELEKHQALRAVTDGWVARLEADLFEDRFRAKASTRWIQALGVGLVLAGITIMLGFAVVQTLTDPTAPLAIRLGFTGMMAGGLVLLVAAIRWRLQARKTDRYTEVIR